MHDVTNSYAVDFNKEVLLPIAQQYFKAKLTGDLSFLKYYKQRPIIIVGNHAGAGLSWDNMMFDALLQQQSEELFGKTIKLKRLVFPALLDDLVKPFLLPNWWARMECAAANMENFERLCQQKELIYLSPEGKRGMMKGGRQHNKVQRFSSSFIHLAKKYGALVIPIAVLHSDYLVPYPWINKSFNNFLERHYQIPFLPIHPLTLFLVMPCFYIGCLPVQLSYRVLSYRDYSKQDADKLISPGESTLSENRLEAEAVRAEVQYYVKQESRRFWEVLQFRNLFPNPFRVGDFHSFNIYRKFWEFELHRKLSRWERLYFYLPFIGYYLVRRRVYSKLR